MILIFGYIVFCLVLAYINFRRIAYDKPIYHGWNGAAHLLFWLLGFFIAGSLAFALPFLGRLFFDVALNLMRGLPLNYVARNPKSIVDKVEKKIFGGNGVLPKVIYILIAITIIYVTTR